MCHQKWARLNGSFLGHYAAPRLSQADYCQQKSNEGDENLCGQYACASD